MTRLDAGDVFPALDLPLPKGATLRVPDALSGHFGVVLIFRGAWCPFCNRQLRAFARAQSRLAAAGIRVVALSADGEEATQGLIETHGLEFPVAHSADARAISAMTGAFANEDPLYLQSTGFLLDPDGRVLLSVYSTGVIGRLLPDDVIGLVRYLNGDAEAA